MKACLSKHKKEIYGASIKYFNSYGANRCETDIDYIKDCIKPRSIDTHKGTYGRVFIAACSKGMEGAGLLAAKAALRSGAGIVELAVPLGAFDAVRGAIPEVITRGLSDDGEGRLAANSSHEILSGAEEASVLLMGPGLRATSQVKEAVFNTLINCTRPAVFDADSLNVISKEPAILLKRPAATIITPHPGEMARLMGISTQDIQANRLEAAEDFAKKFNAIVVLKGHGTVIAAPWSETRINPTGNPGMGTAGSGDVLGGIIAGFIAQGMEPMKAAVCGVYIHGTAGDRAAEKYGQWGMVASDIIEYIPHTIMDIGGM